jgi:NAD(P)-dependent dehydrogenase (short-subunit alcohol dehydrogenase family)
MPLEGKVVVVTGSTRGIGRAIAEACARDGARVVVCSRTELAVAAAIQSLTEKGYAVSGVRADVSNAEDLENLLQHTAKTWGRVDVWVNNAGLSGGMRPIDQMPDDEAAALINVNLLGTLRACRIVIPYMIRQGGGVLLNMSGKGGRGDASPFLATYAASKAAVASLTRSIAREYRGHPVSIHSILPGMVATDFFKDIRTTPELEESAGSIPYALNAFGVPVEEVGRKVARIAAQAPGKKTGRDYSLLGRRRMIRGIGLMMYYRATGKVKGRM